jgi:hypothetical protein
VVLSLIDGLIRQDSTGFEPWNLMCFGDSGELELCAKLIVER